MILMQEAAAAATNPTALAILGSIVTGGTLVGLAFIRLVERTIDKRKGNGYATLAPDVKDAIFATKRLAQENATIHNPTDSDGRRLIYSPQKWNESFHKIKDALQVVSNRVEIQTNVLEQILEELRKKT